MTRRESGALARSQGIAWEAQVLADLEAERRRGMLTAWWRLTEETRQVRHGEKIGTVRVDGGGGLPDFLAFAPGVAWALEVKHTTGERWDLAGLTADQALHLSEWADPPHRRSAVVLTIHPPGQGRQAYLLDWLALGPVWALWHQGKVRRGGASLSVSDALELGVPWDGGRALAGGTK